MRTDPIIKNSYYHIYNRGNQTQQLFFDQSDYIRFLFGILFCQSDISLSHPSRQVGYFLKKKSFQVDADTIDAILNNRRVELINFCVMPNHFHLLVRNVTETGIPTYLHKVSNAYAKYFNTKYDRSGHVFQGTYKANSLMNENDVMRLSAYIHNNPKELNYKLEEYAWSSLIDFKQNRWGNLLERGIVRERFKSFKDYLSYIQTNG